VPSPAAVLFRHNRFRLHLVIIVRISDFCAFRRRFFHHVYFGGPVHTPAAITCFCHNGLHVSFGSNCVIQLLIVMISSLILTVLFKNDLVNVWSKPYNLNFDRDYFCLHICKRLMQLMLYNRVCDLCLSYFILIWWFVNLFCLIVK